jgi:hypothetical protein
MRRTRIIDSNMRENGVHSLAIYGDRCHHDGPGRVGSSHRLELTTVAEWNAESLGTDAQRSSRPFHFLGDF